MSSSRSSDPGRRNLSPALRRLVAAIVAVAAILGSRPSVACATDFSPLETLMRRAVGDSVFPGASIAVIHRGKVVFHRAFGRLTYDPQSAPADTSTIYDAASLTKAVATTSIAMQLVEHDSLDINTPVSRYRPGFAANGKGRVTIGQLMRHVSGLRAHRYFAETCRTPEEVFRTIDRDSLTCTPGTKTVYSDLNFMLLGRIEEALTGKSLAANFQARFSVPLGMTSTMFTPAPALRPRIAPTGEDGMWKLDRPRPLVNDQNAALLGGISGHAGLFTTTGDLARMVRMLMNGGTFDGRRYLKASTVETFLKKGDGSRALGWDLVTPGGASSAGSKFSASSWGHLGFTGTSIWVDPEREIAVILLSNRVWPSPDNIKIRKFRPVLHDTVVDCIDNP
ncbi:MAG: beta-lactamase family protein [Chlorobiaceae bacterium]|nr:beta-lactamase family protein [Chlorobiaceae bacterium]